MSSNPPRRFAAYRQTLAAISRRTGAPLPSLILSFGMLHELTAIVPLVGFFYGAKALGIGERVVSSFTAIEDRPSAATAAPSSEAPTLSIWVKQKVKPWVEEGDRWAVRVGRRYGVFGYEKRRPGEADDIEEMVRAQSGHIAGDVANMVFAYGVTKALLPLRIGASIYLSPMFSRSIVEPMRKSIMRRFSRRS
ncbi:hypothetical protein CPB84DRAFT_1671646 [Gymnopilus junonius]|uniref:Uncharacterized protein n=1 Tax=Gymnopilus junonius TaxID=109634 RepID=A0A9P5NZ59_GYMJU|nr:hypothetical protein CPB84DRAFT_1671646 [Gymnopilus junonius]